MMEVPEENVESENFVNQSDKGEKNSNKTEEKEQLELLSKQHKDDDAEIAVQPRISSDKNFIAVIKQNHCKIIIASSTLVIIILLIIIAIAVNTGSNKMATIELKVETETDCGIVKGIVEGGTISFKGIPYVIPPVNKLRWKPSRNAITVKECWKDNILHAYNYSSYCYQKKIIDHHINMSEDCLYLNVWTPSTEYRARRPVIVYLYGDSFWGYSKQDFLLQPGPKLAKQGYVVVTFNYRLHVFGFLALEMLSITNRPQTSGNFAFLDQVEALKWIKLNIAHFGGDPDNVVLLGHGVGATSVLIHLSSTYSKTLFHKAWISSGATTFSEKHLKEIEKENEIFLEKIQCSSLNCLYNKTSEEIMAAFPAPDLDYFGDLPNKTEVHKPLVFIDEAVLFDMPFQMWKDGHFNDVPVIIGTSAQEIESYTSVTNLNTWNWNDYESHVRGKLDTFGTNFTDIALKNYPSDTKSTALSFLSMASDVRIICPALELAKQISEISPFPLFVYVISHTPSSPANISSQGARFSFRGIDMIGLFGQTHKFLPRPTHQDLNFERLMLGVLDSFSKGQMEPLTKYPAINNLHILSVDETLSYPQCSFWNQSTFYPNYTQIH